LLSRASHVQGTFLGSANAAVKKVPEL
jgi:hypothetical protein